MSDIKWDLNTEKEYNENAWLQSYGWGQGKTPGFGAIGGDFS